MNMVRWVLKYLLALTRIWGHHSTYLITEILFSTLITGNLDMA